MRLWKVRLAGRKEEGGPLEAHEGAYWGDGLVDLIRNVSVDFMEIVSIRITPAVLEGDEPIELVKVVNECIKNGSKW